MLPALQMLRGFSCCPQIMPPSHPACIQWGRNFPRFSFSAFFLEMALMATLCHSVRHKLGTISHLTLGQSQGPNTSFETSEAEFHQPPEPRKANPEFHVTAFDKVL